MYVVPTATAISVIVIILSSKLGILGFLHFSYSDR